MTLSNLRFGSLHKITIQAENDHNFEKLRGACEAATRQAMSQAGQDPDKMSVGYSLGDRFYNVANTLHAAAFSSDAAYIACKDADDANVLGWVHDFTSQDTTTSYTVETIPNTPIGTNEALQNVDERLSDIHYGFQQIADAQKELSKLLQSLFAPQS